MSYTAHPSYDRNVRIKLDVDTVCMTDDMFDLLEYSRWVLRDDDDALALPSSSPTNDNDSLTDDERRQRSVARARARLETLVVQLPPLERAVMLDRIDGMVEVQIAARHGVVQSAVSQAIGRATRRLQVLARLPLVDEATFRAELEPYVARTVQAYYSTMRRRAIANRMNVLWCLWSTSSYSRTRELLRCNRGYPRTYARLLVQALREADEAEWLARWETLLDNLGVRDAHRANRWVTARSNAA